MAKTGLGLGDLRDALRELRERFPSLSDDDLFVLWFLRAFVTETDEAAAASLAGGSKDKNIDAVLIDDSARAVFIVQGKYRQRLFGKSEGRGEIVAFAEVALRAAEPSDSAFQRYTQKMEELTADRMRTARGKIRKHGYRLWMYFATLGKVSASHREDAEAIVRRAKCDARIEFVDGRRAMVLFRDYLDGVAPPIPTLDLEMESASDVRVNGIAQRFDHAARIESWVFSMRGDAIATLYETAGPRLFARNIRGFLGTRTSVNDGMIRTLEQEPEKFFYYNNGVTIICDAAQKKSARGRDVLEVGNPQIINGQQTTRTLALVPRQAAKASVLVKVICVPRQTDSPIDGFDELVSRIVAGTNWQNAIKPSDLMSNDRRQIDLERALRKLGYAYLRKRQTKGEAKRQSGGKQYRVVKKEEVAQAVAGCDLDPLVVRSGREKLFEESLYDRVFPHSSPDYYLPRYWLMREVTYAARGAPARGYAKWLVLNFVWSHLNSSVRSRRGARAFRFACESQRNEVVSPLSQAISRVFVEALKYYRANRGSGERQLDVSQFFKNRKNHHKMFEDFWKRNSKRARGQFERSMAAVQSAMDGFDE